MLRRCRDTNEDLVPSSSSSVIRGAPRIAVWIDSRSCSSTSAGVTPGRSRARMSTPVGSRSGTTAELSTTALGTMIVSSSLARTV
jgi:hypothetical protein